MIDINIKLKTNGYKILFRDILNRLILANKYTVSWKNYNKIKKYKDKKKIIFCLTPNYGNLGDQAIAFAIKKFFTDNFKNYIILEFERDEFYKYGKAIKDILNKDDIIVLPGGGNMGNLYLREEISRRFVINKFRKNRIISMPQTISFTNDKNGHAEKNKSVKVYNNNENLLLLAREDKSFKEMKKVFSSEVMEVPDIVFYLEDMYNINLDRSTILTCFRNDKESFWKNKKVQFLRELNQNYDNIKTYDTTVNRNIHKDTRDEELKKMWNEFRQAKVVITDRLHGMIFSTITKTPCIVLRSLDHKVIESYKWLKDINYIRFVDDMDFDTIKPIIDDLINLKTIDKTNFKEKYFSKLVDKLNIE